MNNENREKQMMADAEAYAAEIYNGEPDNFHTDEQLCETINDFCAGWRDADRTTDGQEPNQAFIDGMAAGEEGMLDDVCEWIAKYADNYIDYYDGEWYVRDKSLCDDLREAMKGGEK